MTPSEPITIILSEMEFRYVVQRGHDINARALSYKTGDNYLTHACGKSNQPVVFIDALGRSYTLDHFRLTFCPITGEPLTGKLTLPSGAAIEHLLMKTKINLCLWHLMQDMDLFVNLKIWYLAIRQEKSGSPYRENANVLPPLVLQNSTALLVPCFMNKNAGFSCCRLA